MKIIIPLFALAAFTLADDTNLHKVLKDGNDQFTAQMFSEVVKANPDTSVVLSAFSLLSPLAQLVFASVGEPQDELLKAIHFPNTNVTKAVFTNINRELRNVKGVELKMANKIYVAEGFEIDNQFAAVTKDVFNSDVENINFAKSEEAANIINTWVEDHTNNRIKNLVNADSLDSSTSSVLVNAIYFKGTWKDKFNKDLTQKRPFHVNKEKTIEVPTMYRQGDYLYGESAELNAKLIEIPYEGEESSFFIILPNDIEGIHALTDKLKDSQLLENAQNKMYTTEVDLYLPKFKIETTTDLRQVLENIGVKKIFIPGQARLEHLLKNVKNLSVSRAQQKAFIEVGEEGAEAAAANVFVAVFDSFVIHSPLQFKADRPFYYVLRHKNISSLFNGVLYEPRI